MKKSIVTIVFLLIALFVVVKIKNFIKNNTPARQPEIQVPVPPLSTTTASATLGLNDAFVINGLVIKPWAVTQDSRCPSDVQCIQAGKVTVAVNVGDSSMEIEPGQTKLVGSLSVTLNDVKPYPISTHKTTDEEYRFSFTFKIN